MLFEPSAGRIGAQTPRTLGLYTWPTSGRALDYAAAGWMPGVAPSNLEHLEVAQRQACRIITGCLRSTPAPALEREADLMPFVVRRRQLAAAAVQRHLRELPGDPLQPVLEAARPKRRLRHDRGWADTGLEFSADAGLDELPCEPVLVVPQAPPWEVSPDAVTIQTSTTRPTKRADPPDKRLEAVRETLASPTTGRLHRLHGRIGHRGSRETAGRALSSLEATGSWTGSGLLRDAGLLATERR